MKTLITFAAIALTAAPVYAESAAEIFALSNTSAAERSVAETSTGDLVLADAIFVQSNSPAEMTITRSNASVTRDQAAQAFFALSNDSAAERFVQ